MRRLRALLLLGTRPEAIKMAPVIRACRRRAEAIEPLVCVTGQHRELLAQVIDYFDIEVDRDLELMEPNQSLVSLTSRCLRGVDAVLAELRPDCVVGQGDTTTVLAAALAAFYRRVPFAHVEAGLRTGNLQAPWPEELNRRVVGLTAALHFAPTAHAADNLRAEGVPPDSVHVTGNPVVDALLWTLERERARAGHWHQRFPMLGDRRLVLITGHRRESLGPGIRGICQAIATLSDTFPDVEFLYPVHLNPNVQEPVRRMLAGRANVHPIGPVSYPAFVWLMDRAAVILSDSGGVQEEAPSLGTPVLVLRETTERPEAVEAGAAELVGTCPDTIVERATRVLTDPTGHARRQVGENPYGDGQAARRIVEALLAWWEQRTARAADR